MALSKLRLGQLKPADGSTTVGDVHFPKVKLLLPFDGSNGATSTTDSSNASNSVTFVGTAQLSTAQSKFGGTSLLLDGDIDYVYVANDDLDLGGVSFTIEFWVYLLGGIGSLITFYSDYAGASSGMAIEKLTNNTIKVNMTGDGADITGTTTLSTGQWYHIALSGDDGSYKLFLNGTQEGSTFTGSSTNGTTNKYIGTFYWSGLGGAVRLWNGYIEDFRITKGVARYTSNFTPPTSAHLTQAGDANKYIVINPDADGVAIGSGGFNELRVAKAWAEFDGSGLTLNASYNVSSVTDHGNRDYTINFGTAMADTNYSIVGSNIGQTASYNWSVVTGMGTAKTTSAARINVPHINDSSLYGNDPDAVNVIAFGN